MLPRRLLLHGLLVASASASESGSGTGSGPVATVERQTRSWVKSNRNFASNGLGKNDIPSTLTTMFYAAGSASAESGYDGFDRGMSDDPTPQEWFAQTPVGIVLVGHDGSELQWKSNSGGQGSTQFTVPPQYECAIVSKKSRANSN